MLLSCMIALAHWSSDIHVRIMKHNLVVWIFCVSLVFNMTMEQNSRNVTKRLDGTLDTDDDESTRGIDDDFLAESSTLYNMSSVGSVEHY